MAIRTVLQLGDPGLREIAKSVEDPSAPEIRALVEDLADTLAYWKKTTGYGRAIAAPQIGSALRGEWQELQAREERNLSELLQHEIDHLDGILAVDRIADIRTMCAREEFEKRYRGQSPYAARTEQSGRGR